MEELEELSPFLHQMKEKGDPFKAPQGYFEGLPDQVLARLREEEAPATEPEKSRRPGLSLQGLLDQLGWLLQPRMALAISSVLIILVAAWFLLRPNGASSTTPDFAALSAEEIQYYIQSNIEDFDEETLMEVAHEPGNINLIPQDAIETEELDQYLDQMIDQMDTRELEELF